MEMEFDFEEFRNRCVLEFCELRDDPVQVLKYHKNKTMKHYAPGVEALRLSQWDNAEQHVLNQTHFAAPFIFDKDVSFGIIDTFSLQLRVPMSASWKIKLILFCLVGL